MFRTSLIRRPSRSAVLRDPFGELFDRFFDSEFLAPFAGAEEVTARSWTPPVDFRQTDEDYAIDVELPGLTKKDVNIAIEDNVLTLSGERHFEREEKRENFERIERAYGKFSRSFTLPGSVKTDAVKAVFKDGVLTVILPKAEDSKPRQIEIH